jgi:hypothetical protein
MDIIKYRVDENTIFFTINKSGVLNFKIEIIDKVYYNCKLECEPNREFFIKHDAILDKDCKLVVVDICDVIIHRNIIIPKFEVQYAIPWNSTTNSLGKYMNRLMTSVDMGDWMCFIDGDAINTTTWFGKRIEEVIKYNTEYDIFTCYTNRALCPNQVAPGSSWTDNDMLNHRQFGEKIWNENKTKVIDITDGHYISGYFVVIKKETWLKVNGYDEQKMMGIDWDMHEKVKKNGLKLGVMTGIYVYHWYRNGDRYNSHHLK